MEQQIVAPHAPGAEHVSTVECDPAVDDVHETERCLLPGSKDHRPQVQRQMHNELLFRSLEDPDVTNPPAAHRIGHLLLQRW
eukprot:7002958-Prymnesium_polylepis.2